MDVHNSSTSSEQAYGQNTRCDGTTLIHEKKLIGGKSVLDYNSMGLQTASIKSLGLWTGLHDRPPAGVGVAPADSEEKMTELRDTSGDPGSQSLDSFRETRSDPFERKSRKCRFCDEAKFLATFITFSLGVTLVLVVHIYIAPPEVVGPGVVVTDSELCASLGLGVIRDGGSSVDAAITTALCQGIVHPHLSGIGGGGVMLVHDGRKNESVVIDFGETAPSRIQEKILQHDLQHKSGLLVGVPGMLRGLHQAHQLYGRMPWHDVVVRAANIAKEGFNVSDSLARAIDSQKGKNVSTNFRAMFLPRGQPLPPLSTLKLPHLATLLERVASHGMEEFYHGNVSEEIALTVQANGGVLTRADLANYSSVLQEALTSQFKGYQVHVPPPPSAGGALLYFLNIIEGFKFTEQNQEGSAPHWIAEALKAALDLANGLVDPKFDSSVSGTISNMLSKSHAAVLRHMISNSSYAGGPGFNSRASSEHSGLRSLRGDASASSQVLVMGPDDVIVSLSCSLNWPFGSGLITPSGIVLNSQVMNFSWLTAPPNMTFLNQHNRLQRGKRPLSFLMPTIVRQMGRQCGQSVALGASIGHWALSGIAQVLIKLMSAHKNLTYSLSEGRLHPSLQTNVILVDSEFQEGRVQALRQRGHVVQRVEHLSLVLGAERRGDVMHGVTDPRSTEASAQAITRPSPGVQIKPGS
ncbi:glutathione hydrolase 7-like isoform X1 [Alosa sapidissima]|uniref:glutathione hydrolase 7-like isoform X1 n=2 Tax=Alosa sapidissima TaxID=34773 RepID=UPI001C095709|nr:glutathione hydrolase 7-like isoform X1 [Alosa sapidissima]